MVTRNKRAIVYFDPKLHRALKIYSAQIEGTMAELINDAVRISLAKDYEDFQAIEVRQNELNIDFKAVLKELKIVAS